MFGNNKSVTGCFHKVFDLFDGADCALETNPFEGRLAALRHLGFLDEADRLEHIGNVIEPSDFGFQSFIVKFFTI